MRKALPTDSLDRLIGEVTRGVRRSGKKGGNDGRRNAERGRMDSVARYAAQRGIHPEGPVGAARLAFQLAIDLREVALAKRIGLLSAFTRALAEYINREEG